MTNDDELRLRLAALDPMAGRPVTPLTDDLKEHAVTTDLQTPTGKRRSLLPISAAAAVAAIAVGAVVLTGNGSDGTTTPPPAAKKTVLALGAGSSDPSMGMCLPNTPETVRTAAHAFEGTVTSIEGGTVSFDVTRWFKGGTEQVVTLSQPDGTTEDVSSFEAGKTYLVAATETEVAPCSATGEKNAAGTALFEEAFS